MRHVGPPLARGAASCAFGSLLRQQAIDPPRSRHWVLVSREDGGALGLMASLPDPCDPGSAEVGVLLAVGAQGRGHATDANPALCAAVFFSPLQARPGTLDATAVGPPAGPTGKPGVGPHPRCVEEPYPVTWQIDIGTRAGPRE